MNAPLPGVIQLTQPAHPPRRFGVYLLHRKLAEGGMAEIFLAKKLGAEGFERDVVIKCMLGHLSSNPDFVEMFLDEAKLAARLHHPNIVQITDLGRADDRHFICMEYLAGEDLESLLSCANNKGELIPIPIAARIMLSALEGLEFAHGYQEQGRPLGLVHRDISPSNIFVTYQGTVKVLDFGIAKASSRMTQTQPGLLKGKFGYMSPEQARGDSLDARSDLFSLGITFHELLTGRRVFELDHEVGVLLALMAKPIPAPSTRRPEISPELDRIVMRALEREREVRYASAAAMRADLEEFLRATPSAPGVSQLSQYMQGLVGQAVVERKTKIPSLAELSGLAMASEERDVGFEKTLVRPSMGPGDAQPLSAPAPVVTDARARLPQPGPLAPGATPLAVAAPAPAPVASMSAGKSLALGALAALVLLALGGVVAWYLMPRVRPPPPAPATQPVAEVPAPAVPEVAAAPVVEPPTDSTPAAAAPPVAQPPPEPVANPVQAPVARARPMMLTGKQVNQVLRKHRDRLLVCGEQHRRDIPPGRRVKLALTVKNSGEVRDVKVFEPASLGTGLASCLERHMEQARFPRNANDPELKIELPLVFNEG